MTSMSLLAAIMYLTAFSIVAEEPKETASDAALKERIGALILKLDDESFEKRQEATRDLIALGKPALPILREALKKTGISAEVQNGLRETLEGLKKTFLTVTVKSEKNEYKLTEEVKLSCTMKNEGDEPIIVLPPLDGSLTKNRQPYYTYQVTRDDDGKPIVVTAQPGMAEDNFLNAFKPEDFVKIEPGKEAPINPQFVGWWFEMQKRPGRYKIQLKYSMQRTFAASGDLQKHAPAVDKLMPEAWEGEKTSNEIEITIKPEEK